MNDFYDELDRLYSAGNLAAVETFILEAIEQAEENSARRAGLYNELAGFYRGVSRYAESEEYFIKALAIFENAGMIATPEYATTLLNFAGLYRLRGDMDKALSLFLDAKARLETAGALDSYAYVSVLNNLALAYKGKGDLAVALGYAEKALALMRSGTGAEHEIATSLNNIAAIYLQLDKLEEAEKSITEALEIYDGMAEPNVHHAAALTTKAVLSHRKRDFDGALDGFKQALELTRRFFGENIEYAICKRNISDILELQGDVPAAAEELAEALRIMERILGDGHSAVAAARERLAKLTRPADRIK